MRQTYVPSVRDRLAVPIINLVMRLASKRYRALVKGAIVMGLRAARKTKAQPMHCGSETGRQGGIDPDF
jgi:hypothetical protein